MKLLTLMLKELIEMIEITINNKTPSLCQSFLSQHGRMCIKTMGN